VNPAKARLLPSPCPLILCSPLPPLRAENHEGTSMANELILIIEDNEKNRKLVRDVLQFKGYQVLE
jgi:hypothetical protein